jgi:hypothetical protein
VLGFADFRFHKVKKTEYDALHQEPFLATFAPRIRNDFDGGRFVWSQDGDE